MITLKKFNLDDAGATSVEASNVGEATYVAAGIIGREKLSAQSVTILEVTYLGLGRYYAEVGAKGRYVDFEFGCVESPVT